MAYGQHLRAIMTTKTFKITALTAAVLFGIAGTVLYERHAVAQTARPGVPNMAPGQSTEMIAPAATITSTVHYQARVVLTCGGPSCSGNFKMPGANRQLNITRISCFVQGPNGSTFQLGDIELFTSTGGFLMQELLPVDFSSSNGYHTLNSAVDLQIAATQHMQVNLQLANVTASGGVCTATGTLSTLG
jgi:hypothetical protein